MTNLKNVAGAVAAAGGAARLLPVKVVLRGGLRQVLSGHKMHDGGLAGGQAEGGEGHVPVQKPALVDQP